jgi:hypothetical protein
MTRFDVSIATAFAVLVMSALVIALEGWPL